METVSKLGALPIDSGALNHMVAIKEYFSFLDSNSSIPIHMGDDSQIILKGKGTVKLEHGKFYDVLYVPSLDSNLLSTIYPMTHTRVTKRVTLIPIDVEISIISFRKLIATGIENHSAKTYEFSKFVSNENPTALLTHGN